MIHFHSPLFLFLLFFAPLFWKREATFRGSASPVSNEDKKNGILFSSQVELTNLPPSWKIKFSHPILALIKITAFVLLVLALARPQTGSQFTEIEATGRDIILALDISGSMQAMDFFIEKERVDRLTALKYVVNQFIDGREGDRLGLVVFADNAFTQCPLTMDRNILKEFVNKTEIGMAGQATAIGDALAISLKRLQDIKGNSKVVVLVSDGKNNAGSIDPLESAKLAKQLEIKIHTVGIGENGPAPFPAKDVFGRTHLIQKDLEFDEKTLRGIANMTGGHYFNAKDTSALQSIYHSIDTLEKREEQMLQYVEYEEKYLLPLLLALALLVIGEILSATVFRVIP